MADESILAEADRIIHGDRHEQYGPAGESFNKTGRLIGTVLGIRDLTAAEVAMIFILHKITRESYHPKRDNRVDIAGYTALLDELSPQRVERGADE